MNKTDTTLVTVKSGEAPPRGDTDCARLEAMTDEEILAAAQDDPDAQPLAPEQLARMRRVSRVKVLRQRLGMTRMEFAQAFQLPVPPLLVITDRWQAAAPLPLLAERLFAGGLRWLSLRDKDLPDPERLALARDLVRAARPWGATVTLHGEPELALLAGAAGVHLPDGADAGRARALLGDGALIGQSVHGPEALARAAGQEVDYVTVSPVFASASKPGYGPLLGAEGVRRLAEASPVPLLGLGGIEDAAAAGACLGAGAAGVAVMGLAMRRPDALAGLLDAVRAAAR
ncbi:thiamine phosphate synthase [Azospirillum sp. SYSU D00513]|uniref:thiamine phosphate synthase n=1 Tax=Azospirillum sp. SYSU D00513 TaxID=2812561 RepID=UPI001FFE4AFE|nr:thiamine phosphate synthase [Azospirillum sp. SYSU D00513]